MPLVILSLFCGIAVIVMIAATHRGARASRGRRGRGDGLGVGGGAAPYLLPQTLSISDAAAVGATLDEILIVFIVAVVIVLPSLFWLYSLAQRDIVEENVEADRSG